MKRAIITALSVLCLLPCAACVQKTAEEGRPDTVEETEKVEKTDFVVGTDIGLKDITDFYYTYENINYDACYQRYRFYIENGNYFFYHETRERPDDYGPTTADDITCIGTVTLSADEWEVFFSHLKDGTVHDRNGTLRAGDPGPWMYLYWSEDQAVYQAYSFSSAPRRSAFEEYCAALALKAG